MMNVIGALGLLVLFFIVVRFIIRIEQSVRRKRQVQVKDGWDEKPNVITYVKNYQNQLYLLRRHDEHDWDLMSRYGVGRVPVPPDLTLEEMKAWALAVYRMI
jgi:hypothetical protein